MSQQSLPGTLCVLQRSEAPCTSNQVFFHVDGLPDVAFCAYAVDGGSTIVKQASSGLQPFGTAAAPATQTHANQPQAATTSTAAAHTSRFQTVLLINDTCSHVEEPIRRLVWGGGRHHVLAAASGQDISIISLAPFMQSLLAAHLHQQQQQQHVPLARQHTAQHQGGLQLHKQPQQQIVQPARAPGTAKAVGACSGSASQQQQQQPQKQDLQDTQPPQHQQQQQSQKQDLQDTQPPQQQQQQQQLLYHPSSAAVTVQSYHTTAPLLGLQWTYDAAGLLVSDAGGNIVMLEVTDKLTKQQQGQDQSAALLNSTQQQQQQQQQQRLSVREVWRAHADSAHNVIAAGASPTRPSATVCSDHAQRVIVWWPSLNPARFKHQRSKASGLGLGSGQSGALDKPKAAAMQSSDQQQAAAAAADYAVGAEVIRHPVAAVHIQWSPPLFTGQRNASSSSSSIAGAGSSGGLGHGAAAPSAAAAGAGSGSSGGKPGSPRTAAAAAGAEAAAGSPRGSNAGAAGGSSSSNAASSLPLKATAAATSARTNDSSGSSSSSDGQPALMTVGVDGVIRIFVEVVMSDVITPALPAAAPSGSSSTAAAAAAATASPQRSDQPQQQQQAPAAATMSQFCLTLVIEPPGLGPQGLGPRVKPGFTACWAKFLTPDPDQGHSNMLWLIGSYIGPSLTSSQPSLAAALSGMEAAAAIQAGLGNSSSSSSVSQDPNTAHQTGEGVGCEDHVFLWGVDGLAGVVLSGIAQNAIMSNKITQPKAWCWGKDTKKLTWQQPLLLLHHAAAAAAVPARGSDQGLDRVDLVHHSLDVWVVESKAGPLLSVMQQFHIPNNMLLGSSGSSGSSSSYSEGRCYQVTPLTGYNESGQPSSEVAAAIKNSSVITGRSEDWIQISVHAAADLAAAVSSRGALAIWSLSPIALLPLQQQQQLPPSWQQCLSCCWITFGGSTAAAAASAAGVAGLPLLLAVAGTQGVDVCQVQLSPPQHQHQHQQQQQQQRYEKCGVCVAGVHVVTHLDLPSDIRSMKQLLEVSALLPAAVVETGHDSNAVDVQQHRQQEQQQQQQHPFAMQTVLLGLGCTTSAAAVDQRQQQQQQPSRLGERVTSDDGSSVQDDWVAWTMQNVFDNAAAAATAAGSGNSPPTSSSNSSWALLASQPSITSASDALASITATGSSSSGSSDCQQSAISCVHCPSPASPFLMTGNASGLIAFWQVTAAAAGGSSSSSRSDLGCGPRIDLIQCSSSEVAGVDFGGICVSVALCTTAGYAAAAVTCGQTELEDAVFILCAEGTTHNASTQTNSSSRRSSRRTRSTAAACSSSSNDVFVVDCLLALDDTAASVCWCDTAGLSPLLAVGYASGLLELYNRDHSGQWNTLAVYQSGSSINIIAANQLGLPLVVTGSQLLLLSNLAAAAATDGGCTSSQTWSNNGQSGDTLRSKQSQQPHRLQPLLIPGGPAQGVMITNPDQHVTTHAAAAAGGSSLPLYHPEVLALLIGQGKFAAAARILRYVMLLLRNMRGETAAEDDQLAAAATATVVPLHALLPAAAAATGEEDGEESLKVMQRAIACCCAFRSAVVAAVLGHAADNNAAAAAAAAGGNGSFSNVARQQQQQQSAATSMAPATPDPHKPAATKGAAAAASSGAFDTGMLDMSAFGGFGFDAAAADDDDWDTPAQPLAAAAAAAVRSNAPVQQQQQQQPPYSSSSGAAGNAVDTGMLDMAAFGGFGFDDSNADHDDWDQPAAAAAAEHQVPSSSKACPAAGAGSSSSNTAANALETGMLDMSAFGGFGLGEAAADGADWDTSAPAAAAAAGPQTSGHARQQQEPTGAAAQFDSSKAAAAQPDSPAAMIRGLDPHLLAQTSVLFPKPAAATAAAKPKMAGAGAAAAAAAAARRQLLSRGEVRELHRLLEVPITKVHSSSSSSSSTATSTAYYSRLLGAAGAADSSSSGGGGSSSSRQRTEATSSAAAAASQQPHQQGDARILRLLGLNPQECQKICHISAALCTGTSLGSEGAETEEADDNVTNNITGSGIASAAALAARWASSTADSIGDSLHSQSFRRSGTVSNRNDNSSNAAAAHLPLATLRANDNAYGNALWEGLDPAGRMFAVNAHLALLQITAAAAAGSSAAAAAAESPAGAQQDRDQRFAAAVTRLFQPVSVSRSSASSGRGAALLAHYPAAPLPPQQQQGLAIPRSIPPLSTSRIQQLQQQQGLGASAVSRDLSGLGRQSSSSGRNNSSRGIAAMAMRSSMSIASMLSFSSLKDPICGDDAPSDGAAAAAKAAGSSSWATFVGLMRGLTPLHCLWAAASSSQQALLDVLLPLVPAHIDQHLTAAAAAAGSSSSGPSAANYGAFNQTGQQQQQQTVSWAKLRALGVGFWLTDPIVLRSTCEALAKAQYAATKDPHEAALMYCALGKKAVLQGLFRSTGNQKVADFLARDFSTVEGAAAASKNAFHLLGQHRYQLAAAFFILAGSGWDAVSVLAREAAEPQLALIVARLLESKPSAAAAAAAAGGGTAGVLQKRLMNEELLLLAEADPDPAAAALAAWISSSDGSSAVNILLTRLTAGSHGTDLINLAVPPVTVPNQDPATAATSQQQQQSPQGVSHRQISPSILAQLPQYLHWVLTCGLQQLAGKSVTGSVIPALHNLTMRVARSAEVAGMPWAAAEALAVADKITDPCNTCEQILGSVLGLMWHARLAASILALQLVPSSNASDDLAMHDGVDSTADSDTVLPPVAAAAVQGGTGDWEAVVRDHLPLLDQLQLQVDPAPIAAALSRHAAAFKPVTSLPAAAPGSSWCALPVAAAAAGSSAGSAAEVAGITAAVAPDAVLALCLSRTSSSLVCSPASSTAVSRTTSMAATAAAATPAAAFAGVQATAAARAPGKIGAVVTPSRQQQQQRQQQGHQVLGLSWDLMRQDNDKLRSIAACVGSQYACTILQQQQQLPGSPRLAPTQTAAAAGRGRPLVIASVKSGILGSHLCAPAGLTAHVTAAAAVGRPAPPRQHPNGTATHPHHHQQQQRTPNPVSPVASRPKPWDPSAKTLAGSSQNPDLGSPRSSLTGFMSQMLDQLRWPPDPWVVGEYPNRRSTSSGSAAMNHVAAAAVAAHPSRPLYVSGSSTGRIYLWQYGDLTCKAAYVPMTAAQLHTSPKRLALHEAVSTPHWGGPAALQFSRSGGRFGAVGDGGLVGLWRQDFISAVDGLGHAEWVGHCLSKAGTGITFLGDTGSQVLVSGVDDRGGAVVLVDTLAPPLSPAAAQILSPKGVTPTTLTLVPGGAGGSGAGPGAVLVVGEDSGDLSGFDVRVLAESRPLWTAKPHQEGKGSGGSSDNGVTCVTCWDPVMIGGSSGILSADPEWGLGASGGSNVSNKRVSAPNWLGDLVVSGSRNGSIALVNAHTGTTLQLLELAHYTERRGLLERVVGSRSGTSGGVQDDVTGPLLRARPAGAVGAAVTDVAACAEGLLSVGVDGVLRFHAAAHVLNEWARDEIY